MDCPTLPCPWQTSLNYFSFLPDGHRGGLTIPLKVIVQLIITSWSEMTQAETIFIPGTEKAFQNKANTSKTFLDTVRAFVTQHSAQKYKCCATVHKYWPKRINFVPKAPPLP